MVQLNAVKQTVVKIVGGRVFSIKVHIRREVRQAGGPVCAVGQVAGNGVI